MKPIETLLRRTLGLEATTLGPSTLQHIVRRRMKTLGMDDAAAYTAHVKATPAEWEELLEAVVVTETWFFRDHTPFQAFVELAQQALQHPSPSPALHQTTPPTMPPRRASPNAESGRGDPARPLRILSLPCSSGEEPYSLVMALRDAGVASHQYTIEAVDISARALARAQLGHYGKNSFRGPTLEYRDRYFTVGEHGYQLHPEVRESVQFARGNLLEEEFMANRPPYDFIFCRNLMIYFDRATQRRALQSLQRLLTPSGVLFVGPAEMPLVTENGFTAIRLPMSFACHRSDGTGAAVGERAATHAGRQPPLPRLPVTQPDVVATKTREPQAWPDAELAAARALADAGQLKPAAALCQAQVQKHGPSAAAFYLLGLVSDAAGDPSAMEYYRKALYLEPDHYEALLQMALLLERNGDRAGAKSFKRRAQRLEPKN